MKVFDKAVWRFTLVFTAILMVVSIGFSAVVYQTTIGEMEKNLPARVVVQDGATRVDLRQLMQERNVGLRVSLRWLLTYVNLAVLLGGLVVSYFLARWILRPVNAAMERQGRFVSDASHELRTPLAAMQMENEVLLRDSGATKGELRAAVASNLEEVGRLQKLTDCLLRLSKSEKTVLEEVDVRTVAARVVGRFSVAAREKGVKLRNEVKDRKVKADSEALGSILSALVENAIKYSPSGSVVKITTVRGGVAVVDGGAGIAEEDLPHIFDRFYRAEKSRTSEGSGLGLALAKELAGQMGMRIVARNGKSGGAVFEVLF